MIKKITDINPFIVEFGVEDAKQCNTRLLVRKDNWAYVLMDGTRFRNAYLDTKVEFITAENINQLFTKYKVPENMGVLSVDIDYNTYWVFKAIDAKYKPAIILLEYNSSLPVHEAKSVPYQFDRMWDGTNYFGASLKAFDNLLTQKDYRLVCCDSKGINAFYVQNKYAHLFIIKPFEESFKKPKFGTIVNGDFIGHPLSKEAFIDC
jgi:hypothetical protein